MQGGRRRRVGECGWSSELRPVAPRGGAHPRPFGGRGCEWEGMWLVLWCVWVTLMRGEGLFVGEVQCGGLWP